MCSVGAVVLYFVSPIATIAAATIGTAAKAGAIRPTAATVSHTPMKWEMAFKSHGPADLYFSRNCLPRPARCVPGFPSGPVNRASSLHSRRCQPID